MEYTHVVHEFAPVYDADSTVLILGSFPSVKSREQQFYYGHPRNRFWKVIAELCNEPVPESIADKKSLLHRHHIALWDVIAECDIKGSSDSSIRNVIPNDIPKIITRSSITAVYANDAKHTTYTKNMCMIIRGCQSHYYHRPAPLMQLALLHSY